MNERLLTDTCDSLFHLGYKPSDEESVKQILDHPKRFSSLVSWLSKELHVLTHGVVDIIASLEDSSLESFGIEVSSALRALHCPYKRLMSGDLNERINTDNKKLLLLEFLTTEAQAARLFCPNKQEKRMRIEIRSSPEARDASRLLKSLDMTPPPANITLSIFFKKLEEHIMALKPIKQTALLNQSLTPMQWTLVEQAYHRLLKDFTVRRMVLIKRLDVTVLSFRWSSRMKDKQNELTQVYMPIRQELSVEPTVQLGDILAARHDVAVEEKTSCQNVRQNTQTSITKVIIGPVPDRGGRSDEMQPPPPEMPSWCARQEPTRDQAGRGRGRGGVGRGGIGFNQSASNYNNQGGGGGSSSYYNQGGGDFYNGSQGGRAVGRGYNQSSDSQGGYYNQGNYGSCGGQNYNRGSSHRRNEGRDYVSGRVQNAAWDDTRGKSGRGGSHRGGYRGSGGHHGGRY